MYSYRNYKLVVTALLSAFCLNNSDAEIGSEAWSFQTGDAVVSSPTLDSAGNIYFGSVDGKAYSLSKDGSERWSVQTGDWIESSPALSPDEAVIYIGSWDNRLYALSTADGSALWTYETGSLVYSSPAVADDGTLYFGGADGFLYSLDPAGGLNWEEFVGGEVDSSVAIGPSGNLFVATSEGAISSHDSNSGAVIWSFDVPVEAGAAERDTAIISSSMLDGRGALYVGCNNYYLYALDTDDGALLWKYETGGEIGASPTFSIDGNILVSSRDGYLYSIDSDGNLVWRTQIDPNYYTSAVVDELGRIYVSSFVDDTLSYLNLVTPDGAIAQRVAFSGILDSSVALSPDGQLYVGNNDGKLYAFSNGARLSNSVWPKFRSSIASRGSVEDYTAPVANKERLYNIALRGTPLGGEGDIFAGFVVGGSGEKNLLVRAVGPGLLDQGVVDFLEDPKLTFFEVAEQFGENDDWGESPSAAILPSEMARVGAFALDPGSKDSADLLTLDTGLYSARLSKESEETGIALVEIYNADVGESTSALSNVSMRGPAGLGAEVLIAGFFIEGNLPKRLLIRAIGPGMIAQGVNNVLLDPTLRLFRGQTVIESNDDWEDHPDKDRLVAFMDSAGAFELDPGSADSAMFVWLEPGLYTAIVEGGDGGIGIALVELYDLTGK